MEIPSDDECYGLFCPVTPGTDFDATTDRYCVYIKGQCGATVPIYRHVKYQGLERCTHHCTVTRAAECGTLCKSQFHGVFQSTFTQRLIQEWQATLQNWARFATRGSLCLLWQQLLHLRQSMETALQRQQEVLHASLSIV